MPATAHSVILVHLCMCESRTYARRMDVRQSDKHQYQRTNNIISYSISSKILLVSVE